MSKDKKYKNRGFTLAEVLITLSIIGVIAAILFPSILANFTERTLSAKRQAFFARMSQAMGEMADSFANYEDVECSTPGDRLTCSDKNTALKFVSEGLAKTYKIASICDKDSLAACDIPKTVTRYDGSIISDFYQMAASFKDYASPTMKFSIIGEIPYSNLYPAAFMTKNGESILLFINPDCGSDDYKNSIGKSMCINMLYDVNGGSEKPNKMGADIGVITSFYSSSPFVVNAPKPVDLMGSASYEATDTTSGEAIRKFKGDNSAQTAMEACAALGEDVRLPSYEEMSSLFINIKLYTDEESFNTNFNVQPDVYQSDEYNYDGAFQCWITSTPYRGGVSYRCPYLSFRSDTPNYGGGVEPVTLLNQATFMCVYENW